MNDKTYSVWCVYPGKEDQLYASGLSYGDADLVATECNILSDEFGGGDYRVAED